MAILASKLVNSLSLERSISLTSGQHRVCVAVTGEELGDEAGESWVQGFFDF